MSDEVHTKSKYFENRGSIYSLYKEKNFKVNFVEDKISKSYQGVIRGFHSDENTWKLINCIHGKVKLVTYDLEKDVRNSYILDGDSENSVSVLISPNTLNAHQCLSSMCVFHYKWSDYYKGTCNQKSVYYNDPDINPKWDDKFGIIVSKRDMLADSLQKLKENDR
tara:strand:- start:1082 stop:1576 length:495 start_codon:yes stop_codon:yes gene_type:complete